jgi:predicted RNase H-like HicB family nuclease
MRYSNKQSSSNEAQTMRYTVVIEAGETGFGAYVPDLPGCIAAGATREEVVRLIQEAIEFHIEGLKADGEQIPEPTSSIEFIDVAA